MQSPVYTLFTNSAPARFSIRAGSASSSTSSIKPFSFASSAVNQLVSSIQPVSTSMSCPVFLAYSCKMLSFTAFSSFMYACKSFSSQASHRHTLGRWIMYSASLFATVLLQCAAMIVAALAHSPSIRHTVSVPALLRLSICAPIACAANTSPPPLLIRTVSVSMLPSPLMSSTNCCGVISSPHQLLSLIVPYKISSASFPAMFFTCQK